MLSSPECFAAELDTTQTSILSSLLPIVIQKRTGKIPSLRRSISQYGGIGGSRSNSQSTCSGSVTPPPAHGSHTGISSSAEQDLTETWSASSSPPSLDSTKTPDDNDPEPQQLAETAEGVQWNYAIEGHALLARSVRLSSHPSQDARLSRSLYVDGMTYLLRGLPVQLTAEERTRLHSAASPQLVPRLEFEGASAPRSLSGEEGPATLREVSQLQRAVAGIVGWLMLLVHFVLPYLQLFAQEAYRYDRKYKISDRVLEMSIAAADGLGRQAVVTANRLAEMSNNRVLESFQSLCTYSVHSLICGVSDGLTQGFDAINQRENRLRAAMMDDCAGNDRLLKMRD